MDAAVDGRTPPACEGAACAEPCSGNATTSCDDGDPCTYDDACDGSGVCAGTAITCDDDPGPCGAKRACNGTSSCTVSFAGGTVGCDDGDFCDGADSCDGAGGCTQHSGDPCTSGDPCKQCNEATDACASPAGTSCDDGAFCNGADSCNDSGSCAVHGGDPCASGGSCNVCDENADACSNTETWYDAAGNLTWEITPSATATLAWQDAVDHCNGLARCGHGDWRLPTVSELRKLIRDCDATGTFISNCCLIIDGFKLESGRNALCDGCTFNAGADSGCYRPSEIEGSCAYHWSATPSDVAGDAWVVNYSQGRVDWIAKDAMFVARCVRIGN